MRPARPIAVALACAALAVAALGLAACGEKREDLTARWQPLTLLLDSSPGPNHASIYLAERRGYFRDAGLEPTIRPAGDADPVGQVAAGRADLAVASAPAAIRAAAAQRDAIAVAALVDRPLSAAIWLRRSGIGGVAGLRGRTVATPGGPEQDAYLRTALAQGGLSPAAVRTIDAPGRLTQVLLGGRAGATLGGFRNIEGVALRRRNQGPVVTPVDRLGVPTYDELVLVARRSRLEDDAKPVRLFLAALARGAAAAAADPNAAAQALLAANDRLDPRLTRAQVRATVPLLGARPPRGGAEAAADAPYGRMDPVEWGRFIGWMADNRLIDSRPAPARVLTNAQLPRGVLEGES